MFTTQQSKRLYTLISAGGILGTTIGSLMTRRLAIWVGTDNILLIFIGGMILAALLNEFTEKIVGTPLQSRVKQGKQTPKQNQMLVIKEFIRHAKESVLLRYMVVLLAIPNMILPLLDYQFNVMVDEHFASEALTLQFFGIFRGVSNALMFVLLMGSSRLITRWGVPTSLLFHPINYCIAFGGIFLRFDIFAGVYARFTTEMLKTILNNPARAILYNFFPERHRSMIRLVLRGSVVRAADFAGSGLLTLIRGIMEPRMLSLVALPLALTWVITSFRLKKAYPGILIQSLKENHTDWQQVEEDQLQLMANDTSSIGVFQQGLASKEPKVSLLCGQFLTRTQPDLWVESLLAAIVPKPPMEQQQLLGLLTSDNIGSHRSKVYELADSAPVDALPHWLEALTRIDPNESGQFLEKFLSHPDTSVKAAAYTGVCLGCNLDTHQEYRQRMDEWLTRDAALVRLAVKVLSKTGDSFYATELVKIFSQTTETDLKAWALEGLSRMNHENILSFAIQAATEASSKVRISSLNALWTAAPENLPELLMIFLKDPDPDIRAEASKRVETLGEKIIPILLRNLAQPSRCLKEESFLLLDRIGFPKADLSRFVLARIQQACHYLACANALENHTQGDFIRLLKNSLMEKYQETIEIVLRVVGGMEFSQQMRIILRAVQSGKQKDIDNVIEVLENTLHPALGHALIPLLSDIPITEKLLASCKAMKIRPIIASSLAQEVDLLAQDPDPAIKALCIYAAGDIQVLLPDVLGRFREDPDEMVSEAALWAAQRLENKSVSPDTQTGFSLADKTLYLTKSTLFKRVKTGDLMVIARACRFVSYSAGETIFQENQISMGIFFLCQGNLGVSCSTIADMGSVATHLASTKVAGEMAWMDSHGPLYTLTATSACLLLEMDGLDFSNLLADFPQVVINLCKNHSQQIRVYQQMISKGRPIPLVRPV